MLIYCQSKFKLKKKRKPRGVVARKLRPSDLIPGVNKLPDLSIKRGSTAHIPSLHTSASYTPKKESMVYDGERKLIGVAVLHKSCLQPVFSQQEAEEIAKMRRG